MALSDHGAEYLCYNIKCFFEHYELEKRILKLTADCVVLKKMAQEVNQMILSDELSYVIMQKNNKGNSLRPNCNPKIALNSTTLERMQGTNTFQTNKKKKKNERALTTERKDVNRLITKSPTAKTHRINKSVHHISTLSNEKSLRSIKNTKSIDFALSNKHLNPVTTSIKKHRQMKTSQLKEHKSKDFTIKKTGMNEGKFDSDKNKKVTKAKTPTTSRGPTPSKENKSSNHFTPKLGKKTEKRTGAMTPTATSGRTINKSKQGMTPLTPKIGEFKDQSTNRSISPIEQVSFNQESHKHTITNNQLKPKPKPKAKQKDFNQPDHKTSKAKLIQSNKKKEITLNTSKQSIDTDSENEITEEILQAQRNKYINTYITPRVMFSSSGLEAIYLLVKSGYLPLEHKIRLAMSHRELFAQFPGKTLHKELLSHYEKDYMRIEELLSHYDLALINKPFIATKTAQNGLNFITKDEESYLLKKTQPKEINQIFTAVLILLNESIETISEEERISYLINSIYSKYKVDNISKHISSNNIFNK